MFSVIYLTIAFVFGCGVCRCLFPDMAEWTKRSFRGTELKINSLFLLVPAWMYFGLLPMTWCTYFCAYLFRSTGDGLAVAEPVTVFLFLAGAALLHRRAEKKCPTTKEKLRGRFRFSKSEIIFLLLIFYLSVRLFWGTFYIEDGRLYVGLSVFSDFAPHLGMIRSFSYGNNFPTSYSHFAGQDIRYHFMFQFLVGNLEHMGMRLDYAFNVPSLLGFLSSFCLLYVLAAKLTAKRAAGYLACLFFAFRSSLSVFRYLGEKGAGIGLKEAIWDYSEFLNYSTHEDWGLWNLNVYCNQRHLAFTLGILLFVLLLFLPCLYQAFSRLRREWEEQKEKKGRPMFFFRRNLFCAEEWKIQQPRTAIAAGVLLGMIGFWNGAVTIAVLLVLFLLAVVSERRLEFLIAAVLAVALTQLQTMFFVDGSVVSAAYCFGFIAENPTGFGVLDYIYRLTGFLLFVVAAVFMVSDAEKRYITIAFLAPFVFAFFVSLTPDVTVNHKYIMISLMLLGILAADGIVRIWEYKKLALRVGAAALVFVLTATGLFEYRTVINRNRHERNLSYALDDPLTEWVRKNATAEDIFLTPHYALHPLVLGGAMLYDGWQYYAWSAGYDTYYRDAQLARMYGAKSPDTLKRLVEENHIRYILVEPDNYASTAYDLREDVIKATYAEVFRTGQEPYTTILYDTKCPLQ